MIPTYRDQAAVIEAAKTVQFGQELPMDMEVLPPDRCYSKAASVLLSFRVLGHLPALPLLLSLPGAGEDRMQLSPQDKLRLDGNCLDESDQ